MRASYLARARLAALIALVLAVALAVFAQADEQPAATAATPAADAAAAAPAAPATGGESATPEGEKEVKPLSNPFENDDDDDDDDEKPPEPLSEEERKRRESWEGHMKPLGTGNKLIPAAELDAFPNTKKFYEEYFVPAKPVIIRGAANMHPAMTKWTDEYLKAIEGSNSTRVAAEVNNKENRTRVDESNYPIYPYLQEWMQNYTQPNATGFIISDILTGMKQDLVLPYSIDCPKVLGSQIARSLFFLSNGGTTSVLHHEHFDDIHCILDGSKSFLLADPAVNQEYITIDADDPEAGEYVDLDVDAVDGVQYPNISKVEFFTANLNKGDCVYIPAGYMQADRTPAGRQLAVSIWWLRDTQSEAQIITGGECDNIDVSAPRTPLSNITLLEEEQRRLAEEELKNEDAQENADVHDAESQFSQLLETDEAAAEEFAAQLLAEAEDEQHGLSDEEIAQLTAQADKDDEPIQGVAAATEEKPKTKDEL